MEPAEFSAPVLMGYLPSGQRLISVGICDRLSSSKRHQNSSFDHAMPGHENISTKWNMNYHCWPVVWIAGIHTVLSFNQLSASFAPIKIIISFISNHTHTHTLLQVLSMTALLWTSQNTHNHHIVQWGGQKLLSHDCNVLTWECGCVPKEVAVQQFCFCRVDFSWSEWTFEMTLGPFQTKTNMPCRPQRSFQHSKTKSAWRI